MGRYLLCLIGMIFLIWTAATSFTQVQPHQRAVIRRFGRILDQKPEQGLHIGWPWGIDRIDLVDLKFRSITVGFADKEDADEEIIPTGQMLTGDHNLVNVQASINYRIRAEDMEKYVLQADQIDGFVARAAESLLAEWVAGRKVDDVLLHGKIEVPSFLQKKLPERLKDYDLAIEIEHASITKLDPPNQVKDAFERLSHALNSIKTKADQARLEANRKKDEARSETFRLDRLARSYQQEERIKAKSEADSFVKRLDQYREFSRKDPDYLNVLWLNDITNLFNRMRDNGRIELLDHFLANGELTITQFPVQPRKK